MVQSFAHLLLIPCQISQSPPSLEDLLGENLVFNVPLGDFGEFTQRLSDVGLVFNIRFIGDEMHKPSWSLFD